MDLLKKLVTLENEATNFGFKWETATQIMGQIQSECLEINSHLQNTITNQSELQEEIGDLLHAVFSLCIFCHFDPEDTLEKSVAKFQKRFTAVKQVAEQQGKYSLQGCSLNELMVIWEKAKKLVG